MNKELKRVMLVDDESDIRQIAQLALEMVGGFQVTLCSSGREALSRIGEVSPDLLILDVMMPELDGPATLQALRRLPEGASVPVAFLTAKVETQEVSELRALGAIEVIAKPFDPMKLAAQVKVIWERHQG